jgi:hypothetical protein
MKKLQSSMARLGPRVSPASPWARATKREKKKIILYIKNKKKIYAYTSGKKKNFNRGQKKNIQRIKIKIYHKPRAKKKFRGQKKK